MQITDTLALTFEVGKCRGYSTPISREVFEANFKLIANTKAELFGKSAQATFRVAPLVAALTLQDEGRKLAEESESEGDGGARALLAEITRLTVILVPGKDGWDTVPVEAAINSKHIDSDEWREALSELVFFTVSYALTRKSERKEAVDGLCLITNFSPTSLSCEDFARSLKTSTSAATTAERAESSVPV